MQIQIPHFIPEWIKNGEIERAKNFIDLRVKHFKDWFNDSPKRRAWAQEWERTMGRLLPS